MVAIVGLLLPVQTRGACTAVPTVNGIGAKLGLIGTVTVQFACILAPCANGCVFINTAQLFD